MCKYKMRKYKMGNNQLMICAAKTELSLEI